MTKTALIIGGSGQIGGATAARLLADGWAVTCAQKRPEGVPAALIGAGAAAIALDRSQPDALKLVIGRGFDAIIDTVAFDDAHARQLLAVQDDVGAFVVISTGSVYADAAGRTLDEAGETGFPKLPVPIPEDQARTVPGPATYSTRKVAMEDALFAGGRRPMTVLRPYAIHGEGSGHAREWWFIKRILDGRRRVPLAWGGQSRFQTTATVNIAALIAAALAQPFTGALNAADPDAPTVADIGRAIAAIFGVELEIIPSDGPPVRGVGGTPWSVAGPLVADMRAAAAIGYEPVGTYAETVAAACRSAEARAAAGEPFIGYLNRMFDYAAEDAFLASL